MQFSYTLLPAVQRRPVLYVGSAGFVRRLSFDTLVAHAADLFGIAMRDILSNRRALPYCKARWALMRALRDGRECSLPHIGEVLNRDHTTIMHGLTRAQELYATDPDYAEKCDRLLAAAQL